MKRNLLMVLGPTEIEKDVLKAGALPQVYMRTADYSNYLKEIFEDLQYVFQTKNPVVFFASSGTGAMEAAVTNVLSKNDTALYINGGSFGKRWGDICRKHDVNTIEISVEFGNSVNSERVREELNKNSEIKAVFATLDETSSGALTDIKAIGEIVKDYPNTILVVDCVSGLIVEPMQMDDWNVDVAVSSSQKALAIPPGLGFMAISEKAIKHAENADLRTVYFDIFDHLSNRKRNQTPFTPAVSLIEQLKIRLHKIRKAGLEKIRSDYREKTEIIRNELKKLGFNTFAKNPANCVTGVMTEDLDASEIVRIMREKHHVEIAPSGGDLKTKFFRVGNFGAIGKKEIKVFVNALKQTLKELK